MKDDIPYNAWTLFLEEYAEYFDVWVSNFNKLKAFLNDNEKTSRTSSTRCTRWSVIQKEAYAIFYVITYLQSLLRDRVFTIRTDYLNLLFITQASNPMIVRW